MQIFVKLKTKPTLVNSSSREDKLIASEASPNQFNEASESPLAKHITDVTPLALHSIMRSSQTMKKPSPPIASNVKNALVVAINELVEEEVTLLIEDTVLTCFASHCPYEIAVGKIYCVELNLNLSEFYEAHKAPTPQVLAERMGSGFSYALYGMLRNDTFRTFTLLNDEGIHYDHPDLNDSFIKIIVDRIDVTFN